MRGLGSRPKVRAGGKRSNAESVLHAVVEAPAIQPMHGIVKLFLRTTVPQLIAHLTLDTFGVVKAPHLASRPEDPGRARDADGFVQEEGCRQVKIALFDSLPKYHSVFQCTARRHAGWSAKRLTHRRPERPDLRRILRLELVPKTAR